MRRRIASLGWSWRTVQGRAAKFLLLFTFVMSPRAGAVGTLGSYVAKACTWIAEQVALPLGYAIAYAGRFQFLKRTRERFASIVPAILAILAFLLFMAFQRTWSCWRPLCR